MKPISFQDYLCDADKRRLSWRRRLEMEEIWRTVEPNDGHKAVAKLVQRGKIVEIITQNIDALHQRSGVPADQVIEIHGNTHQAKCLDCQVEVPILDVLTHFQCHGDAPDCEVCGGVIKTATISFGQPMPERQLARAYAASRACDLMLVIGSSLTVYPAAELPLLAKRSGARLVILNRQTTPQDRFADLVIHAEIGPTLRSVIDDL